MKVVILAGGFGTRISEESHLKPKPMIEIGEKPILWHIMKEYSAYGINEFIICAGYKQHVIKEWFADYFIHTSDITFDFTKGNEMIIHNKHAEPWKVTVVDTGLNTQTGGRIKRVKDFVGDDTFMVTYGDAVGDINIDELLAFHRAHGKIGTIKHEDIVVRNPFSTRPYQHVLEPLYAYLMIAAMQYQDIKYAGYYNVGPDDVDCFQTGALVDLFVSKWGDGMKWVNRYDGGPHEANFLKLDCSKLKTTFGWKPHWNLDTAIEMVVEWSKCWVEGGDIRACMDNEIKLFMES